MSKLLLATGFVLALACATQASFVDTFDGASLHPDWTLVLREDGTSLSRSVSGGFLTVTDVGDPASNNGIWGIAVLRRTFTPITGDFSSTINFDWNQLSSLQAMEGLVMRLLDGSNNLVASVGYQDAWVSARGAYISTAGTGNGSTSLNVVPFAGSLTGNVTRSGNTITTFRNAVSVAVGTSIASVEALELEFRYFAYPSAFFGTVNVDQVGITAIPEPSTWAALAGAGALGLALARRRRS